MFCTQCGTELRETDRYCTQCAKPVNELPPLLANVPTRRLCRIVSKKKIAGVCAGFAEYFDMDLTLMRIIWICLLVMPPAISGIAYIVGWIAMPAAERPAASG